MKQIVNAMVCSVLYVFLSAAAPEAKTLTVVFPFSPDELKKESALLFNSLKAISIDGISIHGTQNIASINSLMDTGNNNATAALRKFAGKNKSAYVVLTEISHSMGQAAIEYKLYSRESNNFIMTSFHWEDYLHIERAAPAMQKRLQLALQSSVIKIINASAAADSALNHISIHFEPHGGGSSYTILRSLMREGPYDPIAAVTGTSYTDKDVQRGVVYWYKVQAMHDGVPVDWSHAFSAVIIPANMENLDLDKLLSHYTKPEEKPADDAQKAIFKTHNEVLKPLYMNPVKLRIILQVVRSSVKKGQLAVLRGFDHIVMDTQTRSLYLIKKNNYVVKLESKKPFELLASSNNDFELLQRLLHNAIAFGVPSDHIEITNEEGYSEILPLYESIGISTTYFKEPRNWASNTILWNTSNSELRKKMKAHYDQ